jgi:putative transposase
METPCSPLIIRFYDKPSGALNENEHARAILAEAHHRGFRPRIGAFDGWYASLENVKMVRAYQ